MVMVVQPESQRIMQSIARVAVLLVAIRLMMVEKRQKGWL